MTSDDVGFDLLSLEGFEVSAVELYKSTGGSHLRARNARLFLSFPFFFYSVGISRREKASADSGPTPVPVVILTPIPRVIFYNIDDTHAQLNYEATEGKETCPK